MTEHAQLANSTDEGSAQVLPTGRPSVEAALTLASVRTCRRCLREGRPAVDDPSLDACRRCFSVLKGERITVGIDASIKNDNAAAVAVTRRGQQLALVGYRIWRPSKSDPLDIEATVEQQLIEWASRHRIVAAYYDPYQLHRSAVTLQRRGVRMLEYPQTPANQTRAGQNLYELITGRNLRLYDAPDLRQHAINAVAIETTRGWRLAKEKTTKKIDGCVALSMACVAALEHTFKSTAVATIKTDTSWQDVHWGIKRRHEQDPVAAALQEGLAIGAMLWQQRGKR